jgi:hypothetical protein
VSCFKIDSVRRRKSALFSGPWPTRIRLSSSWKATSQ